MYSFSTLKQVKIRVRQSIWSLISAYILIMVDNGDLNQEFKIHLELIRIKQFSYTHTELEETFNWITQRIK